MSDFNLTGSRLGLKPTPARFTIPKKESTNQPLPKGSIGGFIDDRIYYFPGYDANDPKHANLSTFLIYSTDPEAPEICISELRETINDDLSKVSNFADLLRTIYPQYITSRNYMDAVDDALIHLGKFYGQEVQNRIINDLDTNYIIDLTWLNAIDKMRNVAEVKIEVFDFIDGGDVIRESFEHREIAHWNGAVSYAVMTLELVTGDLLHYILSPIHFDQVAEFKMIRARKVNDAYELYVDNSGTIHTTPMKEFLMDFLHFDISHASATYFLEHGRAAVATVGEGGQMESNGVAKGHEFALRYISRNYHPDPSSYLTQLSSNNHTIEGDSVEIKTLEDKGA